MAEGQFFLWEDGFSADKACGVFYERGEEGVSVFERIKRVRCSTGARRTKKACTVFYGCATEEGSFSFLADKACTAFH
ncbi:MAG: hypothetical protein J6C93_06570 [Clostridia bacterium]|nr:hypothetical protein [Clostridia bacterium]